MEVTAPVLSLCIATRNRAGFLRETLENLASAASDDVEIVVVDGASTDETPEVMAAVAARFPRLVSMRQTENGGVDRDFDTSVERARGKYCWLMSDDDALNPGAIAAVLAAVSQGYGLVVVNAEVRDASLRRVLEARRLRFASDRRYETRELERLFADTADYLSFIGGVVILRELWLSRDRKPYYGSLFIHMGVIFQNPLPLPALVLSNPWISIRYGNAMWSPRAFEIWAFKWPDLVWSFDHLSTETRRRVTRADPWRGLWFLLVKRGAGAYSIDEYRRWIVPRSRWPFGRIIPLAVALIPGAPLNFCLRIAHRLFYRRSGAPLLDLERSRFAARRARNSKNG